jgi:hypothetical protein
MIVGMVNEQGKYIYERNFTQNNLKVFHSKYHWQFKVRMLILVIGG